MLALSFGKQSSFHSFVTASLATSNALRISRWVLSFTAKMPLVADGELLQTRSWLRVECATPITIVDICLG